VEELTSLVDGHIELSESLAAAGRLPPIDPSQSLTRIGVGSTKLRPQATSAAMRAVARALRLELASAADPVHCEPDQRRRAAACTRVLQQPAPSPLSLAHQVALLFAATDGLLDDAVDSMPAQDVDRLLAGLVDAVDAAAPELLPRVGRSTDLTQAQAEEMRAVIGEYVAGFGG
jgi:F-type H+-transporting ATPase subunit alpha